MLFFSLFFPFAFLFFFVVVWRGDAAHNFLMGVWGMEGSGGSFLSMGAPRLAGPCFNRQVNIHKIHSF